MTRVSSFGPVEALELQGYGLSEDDFSWKISSGSDPRFWVRIEKDHADGCVIISDCTLSQQGMQQVAQACSHVLKLVARRHARTIVLRDVAIGQEENVALDCWKEFCVQLAMASGCFVKEVRTLTHRGKRDIVCEFD
jgi:hypothetical protein